MTTEVEEFSFPLEMHEILDRFTLLYPDNEYFANLRRAYVDKDVSSIFKLTNPRPDFQRAVLSQDLRSVLRLFPTAEDDLKRAIADEDFTSIFNLLETRTMSGSKEDFRKALIENNVRALFKLVPKSEYGIKELQSAVCDKELHNIFKVLPEHEDYRNSILFQELRSIFRVLGYESDLRKFILDDNVWSMFRLVNKYDTYNYSNILKRLYTNKIDFDKDFLSRGQILSKLWLAEKTNEYFKSLGTVYLCAGWYGSVAPLLFNTSVSVRDIVCIDIDPAVQQVAESINFEQFTDGWRFKSVTGDIMKISYNKEPISVTDKQGNEHTIVKRPDTIINTSCEHIKDFAKWYEKIPFGRNVILQGNNFKDIKEHVNVYETLAQFSDSAPMRKVYYEGELDCGGYTRFMKIGIK